MISEALSQKQLRKCHEITKTTVTQPKQLIRAHTLWGLRWNVLCYGFNFILILILIFLQKIWQHELQTMTYFSAQKEMGLGKGIVRSIRHWPL